MAKQETIAVYTPPAERPYPGPHWVTEKISSLVLTPETPIEWMVTFGVMFMGTLGLLFAVAWLLIRGIGIWGVNIPIAWGFAITNFVWWIGIGHAGTLISAILLLLHQAWRQSINRFAEAMTIFAVTCAGLFPLIHLGRPWFFYWIAPYPNTMGLWPQWRSPLVWDMFAVGTYFTISLVFWYIGMIPDLATFRDKAKHRITQVIYGLMAMGWRGSAYHWQRYEEAYVILAGLATPLVISVHTVVSFDFTIAILPGWHSTIFPPYFVAGAIYSGFAMVLTLAIPLREIYNLKELITIRHIDNMAKLMLTTGVIVLYSYVDEAFIAYYSGNPFERFEIINRALGPYGWVYWLLIMTNLVIPQLMWSSRMRRNVGVVFVVALCVNVGMWLERFVIVVVSLHRDFLPSMWGMYYPTFWDWATFLGTIALFVTLFLLFFRFLPPISIFEMKEILHKPEVSAKS
ncbi:MAG TPA: NrfD/PsrC family molybdoenzyme membrane anchor subunit [Terriglobia bacterium]|nr:NrfD/PsrC family molybdoenzyme membrane anchor subunit [Terriglobia bacterium]